MKELELKETRFTLHDKLIGRLENPEDLDPQSLLEALIFALTRHDTHGDCRTVTGVAQILGVE